MTKTYTKIILGTITFFWALLGPFSVVIQPTAQEDGTHIPTIGFTSSIVYAIPPDPWAEAPAAKVNPTDTDLAVTLESFLKVIYVLLWPALFIAGLAMDNSLVYGEIFWLDDALFKFWQIMKNFANFALGFIFVWSILKYIFDLKWGKAGNPKDIIVKLLLWAIGVNMSWFIVGALVDISTALTVWIWWLPLQLIGDQKIADKPIFWSKTSIKLNDAIWQQGNAAILYTRPGSQFSAEGKYFLPCYIDDSKIVWDAPRQNAFGVSNWQWNVTWTNIWWDKIVQDYCIARWNGISKTVYLWASSPNIKDNSLMKPIYDASFIAIQNAWKCSTNNTCQTLKSFTKKTEWYQWAFYSLYASLLNLSTIHIWVPKSKVSLGMEMLIKLIIALAYLIPLLILAVILIMRVWYLWLIIAFSPFIVLSSIKWWFWIKALNWEGMKIGGIENKFNLTTVINLLFLPVIVTFVISLSIVFLSSLSEWLTKNGSAEAMWIYQRTEWTYKCYDVAITSICLDMPSRDIGTGIFDYFSWMIMNLFGIWLMWFAVMAALKSSEFTSKVAGTIETLGKDMMMSANFIPIPWGKWSTTSLWALNALPGDISTRLKTSRDEWSAILWNKISGMKNDIMWGDKKANEAMTTTIKTMNTPTMSFAAQREQLANDINNDKFKAAENMSFWQADNSAAFANMLAEKVWSPRRFTKHNSQELFTEPDWQAILGKWLNGTNVNLANLWNMYWNGVEANGRESTKEKLEKVIKTNTEQEKKLTEEDVKKIREDKKMFEGKNDKELFIDRGINVVKKGENKVESRLEHKGGKYEDIKEYIDGVNKLMSADKAIEKKVLTGKASEKIPATIKLKDQSDVERTYVINTDDDPTNKTQKILKISLRTLEQEKQNRPEISIS